jgi:phage recombination protein Bet
MTTEALTKTKSKTAVVAVPEGAKGTSVLARLAQRFGVDPAKMMDCLKATAFKTKHGDPPVTNEQIMALCIVADQYGLNPWTKEIYAFPDKKNGIIPIVGVDGWSRIINEHPQFDGMEFRQSEIMVEMPDAKPAPEWIECIMHRKDRAHPIVVREYLDETYRNAFEGDKDGRKYKVPGPWQSHTKRFLRHKAVMQCARLAFGYAGIFDADEAERIKDVTDEVIIGRPVIEMPVEAKPENPDADPPDADLDKLL